MLCICSHPVGVTVRCCRALKPLPQTFFDARPVPPHALLQWTLTEPSPTLEKWVTLAGSVVSTATFVGTIVWCASRLDFELKVMRKEMKAMRLCLDAQGRSINHLRYGQNGILILLAHRAVGKVGSLLGITP